MSSDEARAFRLAPEKVQERRFHKHVAHPGEASHDKNAERKFFEEIVGSLMKANDDRFLVIGPGQASVHFKTFVEQHDAQACRRIVGVEKCDKMTDGEIVAFAHDYFKRTDPLSQLT